MKRIAQVLFVGKAAAWTAVFTGVLTIYTILLYRVADSANDASTRSQRAIVSHVGPSTIRV